MKSVVTGFSDMLDDLAARGSQKQATNAFKALSQTAFKVNMRFFLGPGLTEDEMLEYEELTGRFRLGFAAVPINLPWTTYGKALAARDRSADIVLMEAERRSSTQYAAATTKQVDLLHYLLEAVDPTTNEKFTKTKLRDQVVTLLFGGLDTTIGVEWRFLHLLSTQITQADLQPVREEINKYIAQRGKAVPPNADNELGLSYEEIMTKLPFLAACRKEITRMAISAPMAARRCISDFVLEVDGANYHVQKDWNVWVGLAYTVLNCPAITNPDKFDPYRFLPPRNEASEANALPGFGFGVRSCPGYRFADLQITVLIALVAMKKLKFAASKDHKPCVPEYKPTLVPKNGECWLVVEKEN
jgi:cytochrome P450